MKYLVVGAGGTGGSIAAALHLANYDVTLIARGENLKIIQKNGLYFQSSKFGNHILKNIKVESEDKYNENPDVIIVAVKGYSIEDIIPFLKKVATSHTIIIPILNIYATGQYLQSQINARVVEGCMYIVSYKKSSGEIVQNGSIFRIVFGTRGKVNFEDKLNNIADDFRNSNIDTIVSINIGVDTFRKFSFISPYAATGAYFEATAGQIRNNPEFLEFFLELTKECIKIGKADGIILPDDMEEKNMKILQAMKYEDTASLQKDIAAHRPTEMDGLFLMPWQLARKYDLDATYYTKIVKKFNLI